MVIPNSVAVITRHGLHEPVNIFTNGHVDGHSCNEQPRFIAIQRQLQATPTNEFQKKREFWPIRRRAFLVKIACRQIRRATQTTPTMMPWKRRSSGALLGLDNLPPLFGCLPTILYSVIFIQNALLNKPGNQRSYFTFSKFFFTSGSVEPAAQFFKQLICINAIDNSWRLCAFSSWYLQLQCRENVLQ